MLIEAAIQSSAARGAESAANREAAAVKLQSITRGRLARLSLNQIKTAVKIQAAFRGAADRRKEREKRLLKIQAATNMQKWFRRASERVRVAKTAQQKPAAGVMLQSAYRGVEARADYREELHKRSEAAIKVQSRFRGYHARVSFQKRKVEWQEREAAAIMLEAEIERSTIKLQSTFRGVLGYRAAKKERSLRPTRGGVFAGVSDGVSAAIRLVEQKGWSRMIWKEGHTLLHWAAMAGRADLCGYFLELNADTEAVDGHGRTPVDLAVEFDHTSVSALLLSARQYGTPKILLGGNPVVAQKQAASVEQLQQRTSPH